VPASVLKQLRAAAAVRCYDHMFTNDDDMTIDMQKKYMYNMYHGNDQKNIVSQCDLLLTGKGDFRKMYDVKGTTIVTDRDETGPAALDLSVGGTNHQLVLKHIFSPSDTPYRFTAGYHFSKEVLACPTKNLRSEKCSGRYLFDLAKAALANIQKAAVVAKGWMDGGELPSGRTYDDLYAHLLARSHDINPREQIFTGFINFVCHTKFKDDTKNKLNVLAAQHDGDGGCKFGKDGRSKKRKNKKINSDIIRSIVVETGTRSPFANRGLTLDDRVQIIKLAQFEDNKVREIGEASVQQMTKRLALLLDERKQEIELARIICSEYDPAHPNWLSVHNLTEDIATCKDAINKKDKDKDLEGIVSCNISSELADEFLKSVCSSSTSTPVKKKPRLNVVKEKENRKSKEGESDNEGSN